MKKQLLLTYCALLISFTSLKAQEQLKDRFFQNLGFSLLMDYAQAPLREYTTTGYDNKTGTADVTVKGAISDYSFAYVTVFYAPRFTLYEANKDLSISLTMPASIALSGSILRAEFMNNPSVNAKGSSGIGVFRIGFPVYACLNMGMGSTYSSEKEKGFLVGLGVDNIITPIFSVGDDEGSFGTFSRYYVMPSMLLGYRYWEGDKAKEFDLKLSYSPASTINGSTGSGFAISLSWHKMLNY